jgi:hypothetical protein
MNLLLEEKKKWKDEKKTLKEEKKSWSTPCLIFSKLVMETRRS